ncbi:UNVERIFIED_CONTAM: Ribonuclease P protein subunit p30 [Gekko kuhli]
MAGFVDLNIPHLPEKESLQKLVESAAHLGYSTVAINYVIDYEEKKKEVVKPVLPSELFTSLPMVQGKSKPIKILSRLTLVVSDPSHCNILRATSTNIKFYDIFAVFPKNGKLFHVACTTLDVDLVCISVTEKLPFYIKRPSVNVAIDRGIYFELVYVPAIKDSTMRRYTISNALSLMQICRGKNIVLSSAAEKGVCHQDTTSDDRGSSCLLRVVFLVKLPRIHFLGRVYSAVMMVLSSHTGYQWHLILGDVLRV